MFTCTRTIIQVIILQTNEFKIYSTNTMQTKSVTIYTIFSLLSTVKRYSSALKYFNFNVKKQLPDHKQHNLIIGNKLT